MAGDLILVPATLSNSTDDTDPTYTKTLYEVRNKCAAHLSIPDELLYGVVREENSTWAIAFQGLLDNAPSTVYELDEWGNKKLKQTVYVEYHGLEQHPPVFLT